MLLNRPAQGFTPLCGSGAQLRCLGSAVSTIHRHAFKILCATCSMPTLGPRISFIITACISAFTIGYMHGSSLGGTHDSPSDTLAAIGGTQEAGSTDSHARSDQRHARLQTAQHAGYHLACCGACGHQFNQSRNARPITGGGGTSEPIIARGHALPRAVLTRAQPSP